MTKKKVKPTARFKQEVNNLIQHGKLDVNDFNNLLQDVANHLTYQTLTISYLGRIGELYDPSWASDISLGHIHFWDTSNKLFTIDRQERWQQSHNLYGRTSDTCIVYSAHWERESEILLMGIASPCHGENSKLYDTNFMEYFRIEGENFQDS